MLIELDALAHKYQKVFKGVVHIGASLAQERESYSNMGMEVIWVEAIPEVFEELTRNIEKYPNQISICACMSDVDGEEVNFNISNNGKQSSSMLEFGVHSIIHPDVVFESKVKLTTSRMDTLFKGSSFTDWLLNIDIQGAELLALKGAGELLHDFSALYLEVNKKYTYKGCALVEEIDEYVGKFGFVRVETSAWVGDSWGDAFYVKR